MSLPESPWSLDKLLAMRYRVTRGGAVARICRPRDRCFIVHEDPPIIPASRGRYCVYAVAKKGMPTLQAMSRLRRILREEGVLKDGLVFFGLKDAEATTLQYACAPCIREARRIVRVGRGAWARLVGYTETCKPQPPLGNRFWIILEPLTSIEKLGSRIEELRGRLLPNYYGYQRFGTRRPNTHLLGLMLLKRDYEGFLEELLDSPYPDESIESKLCRLRGWRYCSSSTLYEAHLARSARTLRDYLSGLSREVVRLFVSALQAYIFNLYLSTRIELGYSLETPIKGERKGVPPLALVPGIGRRLGIEGDARRVLREALSSAGLAEEDLAKPAPRIGIVRPYWRPIAFSIRSLSYNTLGERVVLSFQLDHGVYATVALRELVKIPDGL